MEVLADIISTRVVDELLTVIKVRQTYNDQWVQDSTDFEDLYQDHLDMLKEEGMFDEPDENKKQPKKLKAKKVDSEEVLVGEMASLMTQMGMHLTKEEYEKCAVLKTRIAEIKVILKDNYNVDFDMGDDE